MKSIYNTALLCSVASPIYVICKFNLFLRALLRVGLYCFLPVETVLIAWCLFKLLIDIPRSADDLGQFITPSVYLCLQHSTTHATWAVVSRRSRVVHGPFCAWPDPTQPISWLTQPNPTHYKWKNLDPIRPNPIHRMKWRHRIYGRYTIAIFWGITWRNV